MRVYPPASVSEAEEAGMADADTETIVRALFSTAGMMLTDEQIASFVRLYPTLREQADRLWAIPEVRYEQPALLFDARTDR